MIETAVETLEEKEKIGKIITSVDFAQELHSCLAGTIVASSGEKDAPGCLG